MWSFSGSSAVQAEEDLGVLRGEVGDAVRDGRVVGVEDGRRDAEQLLADTPVDAAPLDEARIAKLPRAQQSAWIAYLSLAYES